MKKEKLRSPNMESRLPALNAEEFLFATPKPINIDAHSWKRLSKFMKKFLLFPFLILIFLVSGGVWFYKNSLPVSATKNFSYFVIEKGTSATQAGNNLQSEGYIKSALAFKIYLQFTGQTAKLQAGEFSLSPSLNLFETVDALFNGPTELSVTIPEGLRREEVASRFTSGLNKNSSFNDEFLTASKGKEGYLFPDTYLFPRDATAATIVKKMTDTFDSKTKSLKNNSGLTFEQAIVLASILERETKTDAERPIVAGILINRLDAGMPLQVDAAVQYATANSKCQITNSKCDWWPTLTLDDLSVASLYNTYKNQGLPPAPIANPGISSIKAALNPTSNDYWYYIHDKIGQIHYAKTLAEHNANIAKYLDR